MPSIGKNVKELLSCFLFKQFTTMARIIQDMPRMSKSYYRVSFLSNSQQQWVSDNEYRNVKELLSCFLFKQFTTICCTASSCSTMSKSYYRVSFLSNSQHHIGHFGGIANVKELLSCFLFKQFTTKLGNEISNLGMSKSYYRVSFLSNSQQLACTRGVAR